MDTHGRSIVKALSYRVIGLLVTAGVALVVTRDLRFAAAIGAVDTLVKLGVYYAHERAWNRVGFGRQESPDYEI